MQQFILVTHQGPCVVPQEVYDQVVILKKQDRKFGDQILFAIQFADAEKVKFTVQMGSLPKVKSFPEFHQKFIMTDPPQRRNIIV